MKGGERRSIRNRRSEGEKKARRCRRREEGVEKREEGKDVREMKEQKRLKYEMGWWR